MKKSRKKRGIGKWKRTTPVEEPPLERAEADLRYAQRILGTGGSYQPEEWLLVATLVVGAERAIRDARHQGTELRALFGEVLKDLADVTRNFTDPAFVKASRAARRDHPELFLPRKRIASDAPQPPSELHGKG